jgi:hypothetical protein
MFLTIMSILTEHRCTRNVRSAIRGSFRTHREIGFPSQTIRRLLMDLDKKPTIWKYARRKFVETEKSVV